MLLNISSTTAWSQIDSPAEADLDEQAQEEVLAEIDRQLNNPLTTIWSLTFEDSLLEKRGDAISGTTLGSPPDVRI